MKRGKAHHPRQRPFTQLAQRIRKHPRALNLAVACPNARHGDQQNRRASLCAEARLVDDWYHGMEVLEIILYESINDVLVWELCHVDISSLVRVTLVGNRQQRDEILSYPVRDDGVWWLPHSSREPCLKRTRRAFLEQLPQWWQRNFLLPVFLPRRLPTPRQIIIQRAMLIDGARRRQLKIAIPRSPRPIHICILSVMAPTILAALPRRIVRRRSRN